MKNFTDELNNLMAAAQADIEKNELIAEPDFTLDDGFYDRARVPNRFRGVTFATHPNEVTERVKNFCTRKGGGILFIIGPYGTGKTETACCSFPERAKAGLSAGEYINVKYELCSMFRSSRLSNSPVTEWQFFEHLYKLPFMVLDELGQADDKDMERMIVSNILSASYDNEGKIIATSNMTMKQYCEFMGDRVYDRLRQIAEVCVLNGESWRVK